MTIYEEVHDERVAQDQKHGGPSNDDKYSSRDWLAFIVKHAGRTVTQQRGLRNFRRQMIRIAALAVAAVEWCDRRETGVLGGPNA